METDSFKKTVSQNLKRIREAKGLSTSDLARVLGVSQAKISYIEHCKGVLSAADVALLSRRLNVPVTEFFRGLTEIDSSGTHELIHHLVRFGAVLLSKPKGIIVEPRPFEDVFAHALGFLDDIRLHQGFLAALILQAATRELQIGRIFAMIGNSPFLVATAAHEARLAITIVDQLSRQNGFSGSRAKRQLLRIIESADRICKGAGWSGIAAGPPIKEDQIPELSEFVAGCLDAKK